ncbi:Protein broad-minded [Varanus komodoensis]|nr:Protein broad-minded [Varanus komodoensis]
MFELDGIGPSAELFSPPFFNEDTFPPPVCYGNHLDLLRENAEKDLCQIHLPDSTAVSGIHPVYYCSAHYVEMLLKAELPLVSSAFRMSGFTSSQEQNKEEAFHGFQVSDYFRYMENLALTYRPVLLGDMRNIRVQNT